MAKNAITLEADTAKVFPINHRATEDVLSIQNNTTGTLSVKVTNDNVQKVAPGSVNWVDPAAGALTIAADTVSRLIGPYVAMQLTSTAAGEVKIVEQY